MLLQRLAGSDLFSSLRDMQRLQDSLNRFMSASAANSPSEFPLVNVWSSESGAIVRAEVPGIAPEDVDISLVHDTLTIRGSRKPEELKERDTAQVRTRTRAVHAFASTSFWRRSGPGRGKILKWCSADHTAACGSRKTKKN